MWSYTSIDRAPIKHRLALIHFAQGRSIEDVASVVGLSVETLNDVMKHPPVKAMLENLDAQASMMAQNCLLMQQDTISKAIELQHAALSEIIEHDEDGNPKMRMMINAKGDVVPRLPASVINKIMQLPLEHDPRGTFAPSRRLELSGTVQTGLGGNALTALKQQAALEGFTPKPVLDAVFAVKRDGQEVLEASSVEKVEFDDVEFPIDG